MRLPEFIIIGAQKCGTTSLHDYLHQHPEFVMSRDKELQFFAIDEIWDKGIEWYASNFDQNARFVGESQRHLFLVSHALVRTTLSRYRAIPPEAWRFSDASVKAECRRR